MRFEVGLVILSTPCRNPGLAWPTFKLIIYKLQLLAARWGVSRKTASANHFSLSFFPSLLSAELEVTV